MGRQPERGVDGDLHGRQDAQQDFREPDGLVDRRQRRPIEVQLAERQAARERMRLDARGIETVSPGADPCRREPERHAEQRRAEEQDDEEQERAAVRTADERHRIRKPPADRAEAGEIPDRAETIAGQALGERHEQRHRRAFERGRREQQRDRQRVVPRAYAAHARQHQQDSGVLAPLAGRIRPTGGPS